jgi:SulP family sulfate permease
VLTSTAAATVIFDLIVAVEIGIAVAAGLALRNVARTASADVEPITTLPTEVSGDDEHALLSEHIVTYRLDGSLFFGAANRFLTELTAIADVRVVILRLPRLKVLDATGAQALGEIVSVLERRGITVLLKGPRPEHLRVLRAVGALDRLAHENHLFTDFGAAVKHAHMHVSRGERREEAVAPEVIAERAITDRR